MVPRSAERAPGLSAGPRVRPAHGRPQLGQHLGFYLGREAVHQGFGAAAGAR